MKSKENFLNDKESFIGTVAVAMQESGHSIKEINEVCTKTIWLLEFINPIEVMINANRILNDCLSLTGDIKNADIIPFKSRNT